jgi:cytochrome c biogenesis protein CcmG, thiol:disulfide interchange protein DsbE
MKMRRDVGMQRRVSDSSIAAGRPSRPPGWAMTKSNHLWLTSVRALRSLLMIVLVGTGALSATVWMAHAAMEIGQPAPPMVATALDGLTFDLHALHGKVVLVNFWATWCVPCRKEMPLLDQFYRQNREAGLTLIGVSVDRPRDREKVRKMMAAFVYPAAMLSDVETQDFDPPDGVPSTFVVDRNGVVRDRFIALDEALLAKVVVPLLSQPTEASPTIK